MVKVVKLGKLLRKPVIGVGIFSVLSLTYTLIKVAQFRSFNSDDLSWQAILLHWRPFSGNTVTLGLSDIFIDKLPIFMVLGHILKPDLHSLVIESVLFSIVGFLLYYIAYIYFLKKAGVQRNYYTLLPVAWISTFGFSFAQLDLSPMWRSLETGFSFLAFMVLAMIYFGDIKPLRTWYSKLLTLLSLIFAGTLVYSDPYWLYFTVVPIILFTILLVVFKKLSGSRLLWLAGGTLLVMVFAKLAASLTRRAGITVSGNYPAQFVDFDTLPHNIMQSVHGIIVLFGADFFGVTLGHSIRLFVALCNAVLLAVIVYKAVGIIRSAHKKISVDKENITPTFFALLMLMVFLAYSLSTLADISTYRYFFILVFCSGIIIAFYLALAKPPYRRIVAFILVASIIGNLAATAHGVHGYIQVGNFGNNIGNDVNLNIVKTIQNTHLHKGYANYWQSNINTYLSGGDINFLSTICDRGQTRAFPWLADNSSYAAHATKSFYLVDPNIAASNTCTVSQIIAQFGTPQKVIKLENHRQIFLYNYDIGKRM